MKNLNIEESEAKLASLIRSHKMHYWIIKVICILMITAFTTGYAIIFNSMKEMPDLDWTLPWIFMTFFLWMSILAFKENEVGYHGLRRSIEANRRLVEEFERSVYLSNVSFVVKARNSGAELERAENVYKDLPIQYQKICDEQSSKN